MKKKILVLAFFLFLGSVNVNAENQSEEALLPKWKTAGILTLTYSQTAVSDNWQGKEQYARVWQGKLSLSAERDAERTNWLTTFKEEYGETTSKDGKAVSLDLIEFNTIWTYKIYKYLQPYASFYTLSQNNVFWDPVTYIESVGLNFTVFDNSFNTLKLRAGAALKQVDDSKNGNTRDMGAEAILNYTLLYQKTAKFTSEARIYETFKNGEDVRWENKLFLKTGPWLTTEFGYTMYFENSRLPRHHWADDIETLLYVGIGFSFNLFQN